MEERKIIFRHKGTNVVEGPMSEEEFHQRRRELREAPGTAHIEVFHTGDLVCDFCSGTPVRWRYSITPGGTLGAVAKISGNAVETETHLDNDGEWAACDECKDFIQANDREGLFVRQVNALHALDPMIPRELASFAVSTSAAVFWSGWDGSEPTPEMTDEEVLGNENNS